MLIKDKEGICAQFSLVLCNNSVNEFSTKLFHFSRMTSYKLYTYLVAMQYVSNCHDPRSIYVSWKKIDEKMGHKRRPQKCVI